MCCVRASLTQQNRRCLRTFVCACLSGYCYRTVCYRARNTATPQQGDSDDDDQPTATPSAVAATTETAGSTEGSAEVAAIEKEIESTCSCASDKQKRKHSVVLIVLFKS